VTLQEMVEEVAVTTMIMMTRRTKMTYIKTQVITVMSLATGVGMKIGDQKMSTEKKNLKSMMSAKKTSRQKTKMRKSSKQNKKKEREFSNSKKKEKQRQQKTKNMPKQHEV